MSMMCLMKEYTKKRGLCFHEKANVRHFGFVWPVGDGSLGFKLVLTG